MKAIHTRSGTKILLNDGEGSVFIEDPSGNTVHLDGKGNVKVNAPKTMTLNATDLNINVSDSFNIAVGNQMTTTVMQKILLNTPFMQQLIADYYHVQSGKALLNSMQEMKLESPEMYVAGQQKLMMHSDESAVLNSQKIIEVKGKSGNKLSNTPDMYEVSIAALEAKCVVNFRPLNGWAGSFGFDWIRQKDTHPTLMEGDFMYKNFTGNYGAVYASNAGAVFTSNAVKFNILKSLYEPFTIPWKVDAAGNPIEYYTPWLALFPENELEIILEKSTNPWESPKVTTVDRPTNYANTKAKLHLLIEIDEEPEKIELKYDKDFIKIDKVEITPKTITGGIIRSMDIEVTSLYPTKKDLEIKAIASVKDATGKIEEKLVGKLKMLKNDDIKKGNVVFVDISTNIGNGQLYGFSRSNLTFFDDQKKYLEKFLRQALVVPNIEQVAFDMSVDTPLNGNLKTALLTDYTIAPSVSGLSQRVLNKNNNSSGGTALANFLEARFIADPANSKYADYYKIFFFGERGGRMSPSGYVGLGGHATGIPSKSAIMYSNPMAFFVTHELLHAIGLHHSFDNNSQYTFPIGYTENIMDYSHVVQNDPAGGSTALKTQVATWKWQWETIQKL